MKITKQQLQRIIKEELTAVIKEWGSGGGYDTLDRLERGRAAAGKGAFKSVGQAAAAVRGDRRAREAKAKAERGGVPDHMDIAQFPELFPDYECCNAGRSRGGFQVVKKDPQNPCKYPCK
jgi:hypothetical protein